MSEVKRYWIYKGTSNFCNELILGDDYETMVKQRPDGFYDIVSETDTVEGAIEVVAASDYEKLKAQLEKAEEVVKFYSKGWQEGTFVDDKYGTAGFCGRRAREYFKENGSI